MTPPDLPEYKDVPPTSRTVYEPAWPQGSASHLPELEQQIYELVSTLVDGSNRLSKKLADERKAEYTAKLARLVLEGQIKLLDDFIVKWFANVDGEIVPPAKDDHISNAFFEQLKFLRRGQEGK